MPFQIIHDDIRRIPCDALVEPILRTGTMDAQIVSEPDVSLDEFDEIGTISADEYFFTRANQRSHPYVIHTSVPSDARSLSDPEVVRHCYRNALKIVQDFDLRKVAFPLIGSDQEGCPKELALQIAAEEISQYSKAHEDTTILLVVRDRQDFRPDPRLLSGVSDYIRYVSELDWKSKEQEMMLDMDSTGVFPAFTAEEIDAAQSVESSAPLYEPQGSDVKASKANRRGFSWSRRRKERAPEAALSTDAELHFPVSSVSAFKLEREIVLDESFSQMVLRKIDEKGFEKDSDCYTRANIDRRLFSRLRCDENYHPKKTTAVALAIALELPLNETNELLMKAGYSLSHSILFDVIVEYCILQQNYDIFEINELLFQYDQPLLGG